MVQTTSQIAWIAGFSSTGSERRDRDLVTLSGRNNSDSAFLERVIVAGSVPQVVPMAQNNGVTKVRGFILQATYRVVPRPNGQRVPVVDRYGQL
jgi:hypothetical protein